MTYFNFIFSSKKNSDQLPGFTLIESLIYFGMLAILLLAVGTVLFQVLFGKIKAETIQEVSQNARVIIERMSDQIRNAQSITSPLAGQTASSLSLSMTDSSKNPTVFDTSSGLLRIKEGSQSVQNITSDEVKVVAILFTNTSYANTPGTLRIALTLAASNTSLFKEYTYQDTFYTTVTVRPR